MCEGNERNCKLRLGSLSVLLSLADRSLRSFSFLKNFGRMIEGLSSIKRIKMGVKSLVFL